MSSIERIEFQGSGGDRLAARLDRPSGPVRAFALFAHFPSGFRRVRATSS